MITFFAYLIAYAAPVVFMICGHQLENLPMQFAGAIFLAILGLDATRESN